MKYKFDKQVHATSGNEKYQCTIEWRNGNFISDEPETMGGTDVGPDPFTLLLSSLASGTLAAICRYIDQKGWIIPRIAVNTNMYQETEDEKTNTIIDCDILFLSKVDEAHKIQLLEIAKNCPISKFFENDVKVRTFLFKEGETEKIIKYANDEITVLWKPEFCQHSARCRTPLPEVFDYKKKQWINPNGASSEKIIAQVKKCPSGALSFFYNKES